MNEGTAKKILEKSLAQFVSEKREQIGLSQSGLAKKCNLSLIEIENIENGSELFLSSTTRQKLCKGLKLGLDEIKIYEKGENFAIAQPTEKTIEALKEEILNGNTRLNCPVCGSVLNIRIAKMYDLEDNLMLHPKATCSKCPFQIK